MIWRPWRKLRELEERIAALEEPRTWGDPLPRVEIPSAEFDPPALWRDQVASYASPWGGYEDEEDGWRSSAYL